MNGGYTLISQCSINSLRFNNVWVICWMFCDFNACSKLWTNSSCCSSSNSDQHETNATLNKSLEEKNKKYSEKASVHVSDSLDFKANFVENDQKKCRVVILILGRMSNNCPMFQYFFTFDFIKTQKKIKLSYIICTVLKGYILELTLDKTSILVKAILLITQHSIFLTTLSNHLLKLFVIPTMPRKSLREDAYS